MSRTKTNGLSWFPLDVGFFQDERMIRVLKRFGSEGPYFYLYVLSRCYKEGYFVVENEDFIEDASIYCGCSIDKIRLILEYLLSRSLLTRISLNAVNQEFQPNRDAHKLASRITGARSDDKSESRITVLTSHGIQKQYQESSKGKKRDIEVNGALWLLKKNETAGFVQVRPVENNSGNYPINPGNMAINPGNIPKENKIKENKRNICARTENPGNMDEDGDGEDDGFDAVWEAYPRKSGDIGRTYFEYRKALEAGANQEDMLAAIDWQKQQPGWLENRGQYIPGLEKWLRNRSWTQKKPENAEKPRGKQPGEYSEDSSAEFLRIMDGPESG